MNTDQTALNLCQYPSRHTTSNQSRINVDATSWRRIDADTTLFQIFVPDGIVCNIGYLRTQAGPTSNRTKVTTKVLM